VVEAYLGRTKRKAGSPEIFTVFLVKAAPEASNLSGHVGHGERRAIWMDEDNLLSPLQMLITRPRNHQKTRPDVLHLRGQLTEHRLHGHSDPFSILALRKRNADADTIARMETNARELAVVARHDLGGQTAMPVVALDFSSASKINGTTTGNVDRGSVSVFAGVDDWVGHVGV